MKPELQLIVKSITPIPALSRLQENNYGYIKTSKQGQISGTLWPVMHIYTS